FDELSDTARKLPFSLQETTDAYVKLRAVGIDPTMAMMTSFANVSAGMGKGFVMFAEAVQDAATGEFERLKEFGIKARREGDQIALTYAGVTTRMRNDSQEIVGYLARLGEVQFAGAAE